MIFRCSHTGTAPPAAGAKTDDEDDILSIFSSDSASEGAQTSTKSSKIKVSEQHCNQEVIIAHGNGRFTIDNFFIV